MSNSKLSELKLLIQKHTARDLGEIVANSRISEDLKLDGDDASDLLQEYSEKFNVDISNFPYTEYFCSEGFNPFAMLINIFYPKRYKSLTIKDLMKGIDEKILVD